MADLSPMMKQYLQMKEENPDTLLFFRLGDFYELFFDDAKIASRELDLTLTGRDCGLAERAPMCGVPFHSFESYAARLVSRGYKVSICEQMENPATAKGLVKREVIRTITPGTVMESSMLDEGKNNFISAVYVGETQTGVCFCDISTGDLHATVLPGGADLESRLKNELARYFPRELLINSAVTTMTGLAPFLKEKLSVSLECLEDSQFDPVVCEGLVLSQFSATSLKDLGLKDQQEIVCAVGALLSYLRRTQRSGMERLNHLELYQNSQYMHLDLNARRNLELFETMRNKEKKGSLLWVLDKTKTAMGKRLLRSWICQPLLNPAPITRRHDAVEELVNNAVLRDDLANELRGIPDIERLMTRIVYGSAGGRELRGLYTALTHLPQTIAMLGETKAPLLQELVSQIDAMEDVKDLIGRAIVEDPPFSIREGGVIRSGYHEVLDQLKSDMTNGKSLIAQIEATERERTGIPKLKVGYNRVFGYYLEVTNSYKDQVPDTYIRKQTLTNAERYITPELKDVEGRILGAHDKAIQLETALFEQVRKQVADQLDRVQKTAAALAQLDVLGSFAEVSAKYRYTRPIINLSGRIVLKDSRHPVVEVLLNGAPFVPNDVLLDQKENRVAIITGPNMAGKSTYMRQVALIVILAQIGCFVPANLAEIGIVDSVFTRVGASDDLASGQSTFMVEMSEVADILKNATKNSLLILDEIGRGTSTFDGMSIARAVLEYVASTKTLGAKALFATHYHELTSLEELLDGVKNYNIAVKKRGDDITFLRRILRGGADDSYGIEVAKLAGVPDGIVHRAKQILKELESGTEVTPPRSGCRQEAEDDGQVAFMPDHQTELIARLKRLDVNALTPIECMNELFELSKLAKL